MTTITTTYDRTTGKLTASDGTNDVDMVYDQTRSKMDNHVEAAHRLVRRTSAVSVEGIDDPLGYDWYLVLISGESMTFSQTGGTNRVFTHIKLSDA